MGKTQPPTSARDEEEASSSGQVTGPVTGPLPGAGGAGAVPGPLLASPRQLAFATLASFLLAGAALLVVILPAGYGVDPSGAGALLGLDGGPSDRGAFAADPREDEVELVLSPGSEIRWGFEMAEGSVLKYAWNASAPVAPRVIAEPVQDEDESVMLVEGNGTASMDDGELVMPFAGRLVFEWPLPEDAEGPVAVNLSTEGPYRLLGAVR